MSTIHLVRRPRAAEGVVEIMRGGVSHAAAGRAPHWHPEWQLVAVTRGDGWVQIRGRRHPTPAGSLFLIPPEETHANGVGGQGCDYRSMLIDAELLAGLTEAAGVRVEPLPIVRAPVVVAPGLTRRFARFHQLLEEDAERNRLRLESMLEDWLLGVLGRLTRESPAEPPRVAHPAARRARECLRDRAEENWSLRELAGAVGLSRFELNRQFKAAYGLPPHAWQLQARIARAKALLRQGGAPGDLAARLGFADQAHFSRVFRRATGVPPARYRAEIRNFVQDRPGDSVQNRA